MITDAEQVTSDWLQRVLSDKGHLQDGRITAFSKTAARPFGATIVQIEVAYSTAGLTLPTRFLLKIEGADSLAGDHEVEFYQRFGSGSPTPRCFDAEYDASQRAYHLLLQDLSATHYTLEREAPPTQAEAERMIDTLAALHARWWDRADGSVALIDAELQTAAPDYSYFSSFVDFMGDRLTPQRRLIYERILHRLPDLLRQRFERPLTLVHDDAHAWNFLHPRNPQQGQAVLIDWQQWGRSVGAHDLAYLISLFWYPDQRQRQERAMINRYHQGLLQGGVTNYSQDDCWHDYRLYVLRNMLVPLWAFRW